MRRIFQGNEGHQLIEVQRGAVAKDYRNTQPKHYSATSVMCVQLRARERSQFDLPHCFSCIRDFI